MPFRFCSVTSVTSARCGRPRTAVREGWYAKKYMSGGHYFICRIYLGSANFDFCPAIGGEAEASGIGGILAALNRFPVSSRRAVRMAALSLAIAGPAWAQTAPEPPRLAHSQGRHA